MDTLVYDKLNSERAEMAIRAIKASKEFSHSTVRRFLSIGSIIQRQTQYRASPKRAPGKSILFDDRESWVILETTTLDEMTTLMRQLNFPEVEIREFELKALQGQ